MSDCPGTVIRPRARKHHKCFWCQTTIVKGTVYARGKGQWEGEWQDWKMHTDCEAKAQEVTECGDSFCDQKHHRGMGCPECDESLVHPQEHSHDTQ